jgi:hypothetical protein
VSVFRSATGTIIGAALVLAVACGSGVAMTTSQPVDVRPNSGISPVRLGDTPGKVVAEFGRPRSKRSRTTGATYWKSRIRYVVEFDRRDRVREIRVYGAAFRVFGIGMGRMQRVVQVAVSRGWREIACGKLTMVEFFGHGHEDALVWKGGEPYLADVAVVGELALCPVGSPGH